jgi:hypothetical protein
VGEKLLHGVPQDFPNRLVSSLYSLGTYSVQNIVPKKSLVLLRPYPLL